MVFFHFLVLVIFHLPPILLLVWKFHVGVVSIGIMIFQTFSLQLWTFINRSDTTYNLHFLMYFLSTTFACRFYLSFKHPLSDGYEAIDMEQFRFAYFGCTITVSFKLIVKRSKYRWFHHIGYHLFIHKNTIVSSLFELKFISIPKKEKT